MIIEKLENIGEELLVNLCNEKCPESQTLEFKRELPDRSERFLKEVCALANTDGGDLVYGIDEEDGCAKGLCPISGETADAAKRRLGQILDAGIEPRLVGVRFQEIAVQGGYVLIVRIPASFHGPHRYIFNSHSKFVMRNHTYTTELSYDQLRSAFDRNATLAERATKFRDERLSAISEGRTWKPMYEGPLCVAHVIPISSMSGRQTVDIEKISNNYSGYMLDDWGGASRAINLDGLVVHSGARDPRGVFAYVQIFRAGSMEAIQFGGHDYNNGLLPSTAISEFFRDVVEKFLTEASRLGFVGPAVVGGALLNVNGYKFAHNNSTIPISLKIRLIFY